MVLIIPFVSKSSYSVEFAMASIRSPCSHVILGRILSWYFILYTFSGYYKAAELTSVRIDTASDAVDAALVVNLSNGTITSDTNSDTKISRWHLSCCI